MIKVALAETGLTELIKAIERMGIYDRFLHREGLTKERDWTAENAVLNEIGKPWIEKYTLKPEIESEQTYSEDPETQKVCELINDQEFIPETPESAKNAFAITLFCMEAAFDCRSKDFFKYAFEEFPDRDYLIVTQPHVVAESNLLSKFTYVHKQSINTF